MEAIVPLFTGVVERSKAKFRTVIMIIIGNDGLEKGLKFLF